MKQYVFVSLLLLVFLSPLIFAFPLVDSALDRNVRVYIQSDGTVQGTNSILRNGDSYRLAGDVAGPIIVEKDNIVIDGAGYTVTGFNRGIILAKRQGVTVKNTRVTIEGGYVIDVANAVDCALIGNTLFGAPSPMLGPIAINFLHSQSITVKDNTITDFSMGLSLDWSSGHTITGNTLKDGIVGIDLTNTIGCVFKNNRMINCSFSIRSYPTYQFENDLDSSNTVNGKPIYYWVNATDKTVPSDAAHIVLVKCANIKIKNSSPQGISLISTTNSTITNVRMIGRGDGIDLLDSSSISIVDSVLRDHAIGIRIESSSNNTISGNDISNHGTRGIGLSNATNNLISSNFISNNSYAIGPSEDTPSNGNVIASNNFTGNEYAITSLGGIMKIVDNVFQDNDHAILFSGNSGTTVTHNTFTNNKQALYFGGSSDNSIYLNNFFKNDRQVVDGGVGKSSTQPTKARSESGSLQLMVTRIEGVNFMPPPPPSINQYDNGVKGNYWIEYTGSDKNGDGIGDTPYYLYVNNQDNFPLMNPLPVSQVPTAPTELPSSALAPSGQQSENPIQPDGTEIPQGTAGEQLPIEYVVTVAVVAIIGAGLLVYSKKCKGEAV